MSILPLKLNNSWVSLNTQKTTIARKKPSKRAKCACGVCQVRLKTDCGAHSMVQKLRVRCPWYLHLDSTVYNVHHIKEGNQVAHLERKQAGNRVGPTLQLQQAKWLSSVCKVVDFCSQNMLMVLHAPGPIDFSDLNSKFKWHLPMLRNQVHITLFT